MPKEGKKGFLPPFIKRETARPLPRLPGAARRSSPARWERERKLQRMVLAVGALVLFLALAIPGLGYFVTRSDLKGEVVAIVGDSPITADGLAKTLRIAQASAARLGFPIDLSANVNAYLEQVVENELLDGNSLALGFQVEPQEVEQAIRGQLYPAPQQGETPDPVKQEQLYRERLKEFLSEARVSEGDFREYIRKHELSPSKAREAFEKRLPGGAEQVYVHWIYLTDPEKTAQVQTRLKEGEEFAKLAEEFNEELSYANEKGEVGWVPRGAFSVLDTILFTLEKDKVSDPIGAGTGSFFVKVTDGPLTRELTDDRFRQILGGQEYRNWLAQQYQTQLVFFNLTPRTNDWVANQVRSRPANR